jgi:hypothetical protein
MPSSAMSTKAKTEESEWKKSLALFLLSHFEFQITPSAASASISCEDIPSNSPYT